MVRSADGGKTWQGPIYPIPVPTADHVNVWGNPLPAYNRGAMCEGKNGRIYWSVATSDAGSTTTSNHLLISDDKGVSLALFLVKWLRTKKYHLTKPLFMKHQKGDLVAFLRTANMFGSFSCISRSTDGGKSFKWQSMGFYGYPLHALKLPDNRVLLTYGYRNKPYGIRARILNSECTDFASAPEFIIRADGGNGDLGYTWSTMLDKNRALVVYYFNTNNGSRYIGRFNS